MQQSSVYKLDIMIEDCMDLVYFTVVKTSEEPSCTCCRSR
jgi:hypothetical protein